MTDALLKAALSETATELAIAKAEMAELRKLNASLSSSLSKEVSERTAELAAAAARDKAASRRLANCEFILASVGFDVDVITQEGLWVIPAMNYLQCSIGIHNFVGPLEPGALNEIHAVTARRLIANKAGAAKH
jgi:hypothetical protein